MKLIKLTLANGMGDVYINPDHIGHCYRVPEKTEYSKPIEEYTRVGVTTHNNGGFQVKQTPEQIIKLITETRCM
jgi:hypothetical protein